MAEISITDCSRCSLPKKERPVLQSDKHHCNKCHRQKSKKDMVVGSKTECKRCHADIQLARYYRKKEEKEKLAKANDSKKPVGAKKIEHDPNGESFQDVKDAITDSEDEMEGLPFEEDTVDERVFFLEGAVDYLANKAETLEDRVEELEAIIKKLSLAFSK